MDEHAQEVLRRALEQLRSESLRQGLVTPEQMGEVDRARGVAPQPAPARRGPPVNEGADGLSVPPPRGGALPDQPRPNVDVEIGPAKVGPLYEVEMGPAEITPQPQISFGPAEIVGPSDSGGDFGDLARRLRRR